MASVMVVIIFALRFTLKNRVPLRWQYLMWMVLIIRLLLPWAPESQFSLYNVFSFTDHQSTRIIITADYLENTRPVIPAEETLASGNLESETVAPSNVTSDERPPIPWKYLIIFGIWLMGVITFAFYMIKVNRKFNRSIVNDSTDALVPSSQWVHVLEDCKVKLGMKRSLPLLVTNAVKGPTLYGFFRPRILLPNAGMDGFSDKELSYIFLHELVHYKRRDILVNWIMTVQLLLHWFNPILWVAYRKMREDQEISCDAITISHIRADEIREYGYTIVKMLEKKSSRSQRLLASANFSMGSSQLKRRIRMITRFKKNSYKWSVVGLLTMILLTTVSLTNAKADHMNPTLVKELAAMEKKNAPILADLNSSIRGEVEQTIYDVMHDLGKALPLKEMSAVPESQQWFLEFIGDGTGHTYIWVNEKTGKLERVKLGIDLPLDSVDSTMLGLAKQALKDEGYEGLTDFMAHRVIEFDPELDYSYEVQTRFVDGPAEVLFSNDEISQVFFEMNPDHVTEEQNQRGQAALSTLREQAGDQLIAAHRLIAGEEGYINLQYKDGSHVNYHPESYEISQIAISETAVEKEQKVISMTPEQLTKTAAPIASELFQVDLGEYTLTMHKKVPGTATFSKEGQFNIHVSYNKYGEIYFIDRNNLDYSK
ncbi:M56 family metallopeptidase [Paenibacillus sp. ISL-20]|uniref:M56 family metallopeptidase n=1 Tax=Paenibacillus sp. ISL-20 TaxID=2819163 RepID=UPI001BEBB0B3|nr:M56 family metallopeptidase [Paenibacillus sp. ISL-20]